MGNKLRAYSSLTHGCRILDLSKAPKTYCQETVVLTVKGGNQTMTFLFIPAFFSLAVIAFVWIRDAVKGN